MGETGKMMNKKLLLIFPVSLLVTFLLISQTFNWINREEEAMDADQTEIIQEHVKDRFNLFLKLPLSLGYLGSNYFSTNSLVVDDSPFARNLLTLNKDILGLNLVNAEGIIVDVFPPTANQNAKGKKTQNFMFLKSSLERNERFWLSPPFTLFQGQQGFVFYVPIIDHKGHHKGWFAPVISTSMFDTEFKLEEFLKTYDLIIRDVGTGIPYFATGVGPEKKQKSYERKSTLFNRELEFLSWRKDPKSHLNPRWEIILLAALVPAFFITFMMNLYYQRRSARHQLKDISLLLGLTSKEALAKLVDLQNEFYKIGATENISFVTNLIEQIELLQTIAYTGEEMTVTTESLLPLLENELSNLNEIIEKKNLHVTFNQNSFKDVNIEVNNWLFQNCVLNNILTHSIIHSEVGTTLNIDCKKEDDKAFITFHTQMVMSGPDMSVTNVDRRMEVAKRALSIYKGELFLQRDLGGGIIIRITLPI